MRIQGNSNITQCRMIYVFLISSICFGMLVYPRAAHAQFELLEYLEKAPGTENKKITSERSPKKKYTQFRAFVQNNFTYFNFYFNARDKFDDIVRRAQYLYQQKDIRDFEIAFGDEDLPYIASKSMELDSIIVVCKAGILLHDLRGKWIDDLLLLMGQCYYYKQQYDTAFTFFQYLNNAYKTGAGYDDRTIFLDEPSRKYSIVSIEGNGKRDALARNDALVWIAKTLSAMGESHSAFAIINLLSKDPHLPKRLYKGVLQAQAYAHYHKEEFAEAAETLEKMYGDAFAKKRLNDNYTKKALLVAQLYQRGFRYHDAYRMYMRTSEKTHNTYASMYAQIKSIGLDFVNRIPQQIDQIITNRKFKKYEEYMYYELACKLHAMKSDQFGQIISKALTLAPQLTNDRSRKIYLMAISYYLKHDLYLEASKTILTSGIQTITLQESDEYHLESVTTLNALIRKYEKIEEFDSLLTLSHLPEAKLIATIDKLKKKRKTNKQKLFAHSEAKQSQIQNWYFDNDYLVIKGYQQFVEKFQHIMNIDMWRNNPVAEVIQTDYVSQKSKQEDPEDAKLTAFLSRIPTVHSARHEMYDSLFYALGDFIFFTINAFGYSKNIDKFVKRALELEKELTPVTQQSPMMRNLLQVLQLATGKNIEKAKPTLTVKRPATTSLVFEAMLDDYWKEKYAPFLDDTYSTTSLSAIEKQKYLFMRASCFFKNKNMEEGKRILKLLLKDEKTDTMIAEKSQQLLTYLE